MIGELTGEIAERRTDSMVIRVDGTGLGLEVSVPDRSLAAAGDHVHLFTSLQFSSDGAFLAGFETIEERRVYEALLSVNSVGPRTAVRVLSTHPAKNIFQALDAEDPKPFQAVPGIGGKTASRIILELRGKLVAADSDPDSLSADEDSIEVLEVLLNQGFSRAEATIALNQSAGETMPVTERITAALRFLHTKSRTRS